MIGFINTYLLSEDAPENQHNYGPMVTAFLNKIWPDDRMKMYEYVLGRRPRNLDECEGYIIGGSSCGAYDDLEWIHDLSGFIQECAAKKKKLVGICFGHQLIAHSLGGKAEKSKKGWGVGVREFQITEYKPWMNPSLKNASLIFSHQDQVVRLPTGATHLARSPFCEYEMYCVGDRIFSFQGHPEFTVDHARERLDSRRQLVGEETYNAAVKSLSAKTNAGDFRIWLQRFFD